MSNDKVQIGEYAFPTWQTKDGYTSIHATGGMTLRDYFAAKAMQGLLTQAAALSHDSPPTHQAARLAYIYADAMLVEREMKP